MSIRVILIIVFSVLLTTATANAQNASAPASPPQSTQQPTVPPFVVVDPIVGVPPNSIVVQQSTPLGYSAYYRNIERAEPIWPGPGFRASFTGGFESHSHLLGATAALRYRLSSTFALDAGAGYLAGSDDQHSSRREIPVFIDGLVYLIPRKPVQIYLVGGVHGAFAHAEGVRPDTGLSESVDGFYLGGQAGLGIEFCLHPFVYLVADVRGAMRKRVSGPSTLSYIDYDAQGNPTHVNNWSPGLVFNAGLLFYF